MNGQKKDALAEVGGGSQGVTQKLGQPSGRDDVAFCFQDTTIPPAVQLLDDLGFDVIPLRPLKKLPLRLKWQSLPAAEQWQGAPAGCNVGLRHGGPMRLASVEAEWDHPEAAPILRRYFAGLGWDWGSYPANRTARGGERYFFAVVDAPNGHSRRMAVDFGGGEFRFGPGAQAVIAPSILADGGRYELIAGGWDGELPLLEWADFAPLLANPRRLDDAVEVAPTPSSAFAQAVADGENLLPQDVRERLRGKGGSDYPSQSDFTTLLRLATLGIDEDTALALLLVHGGFGHLAYLTSEHGTAAALAWFHAAYGKASAYAERNCGDVSQRLAQLITQAELEPWPGRTGATDKAVYMAHLRIAADANTPLWVGAARRLAELANVDRITATRATFRLLMAGRLEFHSAGTGNHANEYALPDEDSAQTAPIKYVPSYLIGAVCAHDVFSWHGLGKAAGLVYSALQSGPGTVKELAERSGRHRATVKRALSKLAALDLAEEAEPGSWQVADNANLDDAARLLGAAGTGEKRKVRHALEREDHATGYKAWKARVKLSTPERQMTPEEVKHALKPKPRRKRR